MTSRSGRDVDARAAALIARPCPACQTVHGSDAAVAIGRFDPVGVHGYRSRNGGPLRPTRDEAVADFCGAKAGENRG